MIRRIRQYKKVLLPSCLALLTVGIALSSLISSQSAYAAFPTNGTVLDDFNRPNTTAIGGSTASSGYQWSSTMIQASLPPAIGISNNQATYFGGPDNAYLTTPFGPDSEASIEVPVVPGGGNYVGIFSRIQDPGSSAFDAYALIYIHPSGGNAVWSLRRYTNGSSQVLSDISAPAISDGNSLGLEVTGTGASVSVTAYRKAAGSWTAVGNVNDTDPARITSGGFLGLTLSDTGTRLDNFSGGSLVTNTAPAAPSLSFPANGSSNVSSTPQFKFRSTDTDNDYLRYKLEICSAADCSTILTTAEQNASQTGWSGQDSQSNTAYTGNSSIASSTLAIYTPPTALNPNTQYWWRAYAIDPAGSNTYSAASPIYSFTTAANHTPNGGNTTPDNSGSDASNYASLPNQPHLK